MDLAYTPQEEEFRARLREWLAKALPTLPAKPSPENWPGRRTYDLGWQRMLYDAGYAHVHWDASPTTRLIFLEETEAAGAPYVGAGFVGLLHAGPTIAAEGTAEQRERWLAPILRGEEVWCQGFSEPDAGSDLAALRTRAQGWRRLCGHRVQDLDLARRGGRLVRAAGADGSGGSQAPGHHLAGDAHVLGRCRRSPLAHARRVRRVRRGVPRRGAGAGGEPGGRGERRLARDHGDAVLRARHGLRGRGRRLPHGCWANSPVRHGRTGAGTIPC